MGLFSKKQADVDPAAAQRLQEQVDTVRAVMRHYAPGTRLTFGAPTRCPSCGDYGFVQSVNKLDSIAHNHCFGCQADWVITLPALRIVEAEPVPRQGEPLPALAVDPAPAPPAPAAAPTPFAAAPLSAPPIAPAPQPAPAPRPLFPTSPMAPAPAPGTPVAPAAALPYAPTPPAAPAAPAPEPALPYAPATPAAPVAPRPAVNLPPTSEPVVYADRPHQSSGPAATGTRPLRVIVVEDNPFDLAVLQDLVEHLAPGSITLLEASTRGEAEQLASSTEYDLVLLTLDLPDSTGITTLLEWQHHVAAHAPVIVLSDSSDADTMKEARLLGASQFIRKDQIADLADAGAAGSQRLEKLLRSTVTRAASAAAARRPI